MRQPSDDLALRDAAPNELRLRHGLDFSKATFTSIGERAFFGFQAKDETGSVHYPVTLPKTLASVGKQAFYGYNGWNQLYVFLGDRPAFAGTQDLDPQGGANRRYYLVVDAKRFPKWTASDDFIPLADSDKELPDYPAAYLHGRPVTPVCVSAASKRPCQANALALRVTTRPYSAREEGVGVGGACGVGS